MSKKMTRRYVVKRLPGQRGSRRWVPFDTVQNKWADDAWTTKADAQAVVEYLNRQNEEEH